MCNHKHREQTSDYKEPIRSIVQNTNTEYKEKIQNMNTTYEIQSGNTKNNIQYEYKVNHSP